MNEEKFNGVGKEFLKCLEEEFEPMGIAVTVSETNNNKYAIVVGSHHRYDQMNQVLSLIRDMMKEKKVSFYSAIQFHAREYEVLIK